MAKAILKVKMAKHTMGNGRITNETVWAPLQVINLHTKELGLMIRCQAMAEQYMQMAQSMRVTF